MSGRMKAAIFVEPGRIILDEKPIPDVGPLDALIRISTTTICGTDVHILKGEYPVERGLTIGHEPVGVIEKLGSAVKGYREGQRVIAGAICTSGHSHAALCGCHSQDGAGTKHGWKPLGGWKFGNTIDGTQAEYVLVPDAMANLAPVPDALSDEQVLMCPDILSTGFSGAESGKIRIGDTVAVFAQGPIGLCATAGARLMGATTIIAVDSVPARMDVSRRMGADHVIDFSKSDPVSEILTTDGWTRRRCSDRGLGEAGDVRWSTQSSPPGRQVVIAGCLLRRSHNSTWRFPGGSRRPHDRDHSLSRWQGANAPPYRNNRIGSY